MSQAAFFNPDARDASALALLLGLNEPRKSGSSTVTDLGTHLRVQLAMPLNELDHVLPWSRERIKKATRVTKGPKIKKIEDLLDHPNPPIDALRMLKSYAKVAYFSTTRPMPKQVALMLYYLAITAAMVDTDEVITTLKRPRLIRSLKSRLQKHWIDARLAKLFHRALIALGADVAESHQTLDAKTGTATASATATSTM